MCLRVASEVTLLEILPCQISMCGVAYSCSYVLLFLVNARPFPEHSSSRATFSAWRAWLEAIYRRLPGCVVMGINRTRRLFGRQKKDAWAASQCTLYGFRPRCNHFLSPLFLFFSFNGGRGNNISGTLIDTFSISTTSWNNPWNFPAVDFDWIIDA